LIPQIVDIIKDPEGFICLIMHKYKCSLEEILQEYIRGEMSEEEILRIIAMIGLSLSYIHQRNIVHRDFKP